MELAANLQEIESLLNEHCKFRSDCLNLIASENTPSPLVERLHSEELNRRYGYYTGIDLHQRAYRGNRFIAQIEHTAHELAKQLFGVAHVDLRPLSGNIAGIAAAFALGSPGDIALEVHNAHRYAHKLASSFLKVELQSIAIPWDGANYNIDLDRTIALIQQHRPKLVIIGSALFLFPQPVRELKLAMRKYNPDSYLIYDAAHVMGLIAGGRFQSPLDEGADVIVTSTHKTLAGPQGGMILTNDDFVAERIGSAIAPLLIANHHLGRLPALAAAFLEWLTFGDVQATAIIENAKALAKALDERGLRLVGAGQGYTESHTILPIVDEFGEGEALAKQLEACHIIVGSAEVPAQLSTHGLRIGVQEVTRYGMTPEDAPAMADCIVRALGGDNLEGVKRNAIALANRFNRIRFRLDDSFET